MHLCDGTVSQESTGPNIETDDASASVHNCLVTTNAAIYNNHVQCAWLQNAHVCHESFLPADSAQQGGLKSQPFWEEKNNNPVLKSHVSSCNFSSTIKKMHLFDLKKEFTSHRRRPLSFLSLFYEVTEPQTNADGRSQSQGLAEPGMQPGTSLVQILRRGRSFLSVTAACGNVPSHLEA